MKLFAALLVWIGICLAAESRAQVSNDMYFSVVENKADQRVDVMVNGKPFTSYIYPENLMKPVLYPIRTSKGTLITRGWPLDPRPGERVDHPHHVGMWFNYGDVNGLDFWNNSTVIPEDKKKDYGLIKHRSVDKIESGKKEGVLEVSADWQSADGSNLLRENTRYVFSGRGNLLTIERITKLTALNVDVSFRDNKEGVLGIRVARELEHPTDKPEKFTDANGLVTEVGQFDNTSITGKYRSSEGIEGDDVWGTRAKWVSLNAKIGEEAISLVILDHPKNIGYPTYWHARGYGLFAANPLGQKAMSEGKEELDFKLPAGDSVVFRHKVLINSGSHLTDEQVNEAFSSVSF